MRAANELATSNEIGSAANHIYSKTNPLDAEFPELVGVNPHYVESAGPGVNINCASCANAAHERLTRANPEATSQPSGRYANRNELLPSAPMGFGDFGTVSAATQEMIRRGEGATAPLIIKQGDSSPMHVVNTVNRDGKVRFIDAQSSHVVELHPGVSVQLANPGID